MDFLLLAAILLLVIIALLLILYPLWQQSKFQPASSPGSTADHQTLEEYQAQYQAALASIKDLDFDYEMRKVSQEDYSALLTQAKLEAARIRRKIDLIEDTANLEPVDNSLDIEIEQLIARSRQDYASGDETLLAEVDIEIEQLKPASGVSATRLCPHCGKSLQADDQFCAGCGQPVGRPDTADAEVDNQLCPECGYQFEIGDAFCARCGAALGEQIPVPQKIEDA